jgi:DNA helicase-4
MPDADLIGLMRTFIAHAKSNCLTLDDMAERLRQMPEDQFKERHRRFLEIASPVFQAWDNALADEHGIDFEDMLNMAAGLLEQGHYESPYELVMADEFQDASRARAGSAERWSANRAATCLRWAMTGSRSIASPAPTFR